MEEHKKTLIQRFGAEAVIALVIASVAVFVTIVSFQQHTIDFERVAQRDIQRIESRLAAIEERERSDTQILTRVDTHVEGLRIDMADLREQVIKVLTHISAKE